MAKGDDSTLNGATLDPMSLPALSLAHRVPALTIACHPELGRVGQRAMLGGLSTDQRIALSRTELSFSDLDEEDGEPLLDRHIGRDPIILSRDPAGIRIDTRRTSTRLFLDGTLVSPMAWVAPDRLERGVCLELSGRIALYLHLAQARPAPKHAFGFIGRSDGLLDLLGEIERAGRHLAPVLILGESGSGKELVARAIHAASTRARGPFESVNVAAIPASTAAAELFGHARGAFTGAGAAHGGWFGRADGGSLFLDEIGETPDAIQPVLLRAIEAREVQPVGAQGVRKVDVRVITATDADLAEAAARGRFRFPLLQRLAGQTIAVPPLRARKADVGLLLVRFVERELRELGMELPDTDAWLPAPLVARALRYDWPGNVRELANFARDLVLGSLGREVARVGKAFDAALPPAREGEERAEPEQPAAADPTERQPIDDQRLIATLRQHRWQIAATAKALGISKNTLYQLMERCSTIRKARDLGRDEISACRAACAGDIAQMAERLEVSERGLKLRMTELGIE